MGHPKPSAAGNVLVPRFKTRPQQANELSSAVDTAVVRIAERFAPSIRSSSDADSRVSDKHAAQPVDDFGSRRPIFVLIFVALLPSLIFGTMLSLGFISARLPNTTALAGELGPSILSASVADVPFPATRQTESNEILPAVLAIPAILEAKAGESTPLTLALSRTGALPARSIVTIQGLPHGSTMTSGRPYGEGGWNLRSDEIGSLRLILPETAEGEATLGIRVVTPGGEDITSAEMLLKVIPPTNSFEASSERDEPVAKLKEGVQPFVTDYTQQGNYDAMLALGATVDAVAESPRRSTAEMSAELTADDFQEGSPSSGRANPKTPKTRYEPALATISATQSSDDNSRSWVVLSAFVNLRHGPSSSRRVIDVIQKGSRVRVIGRERGWLNVTDAKNSQTGWIYSRYVASATQSPRAHRGPRPSSLGSPKSASGSDTNTSVWTRVGRWVIGP
jgi:uncharacterized protein YraI